MSHIVDVEGLTGASIERVFETMVSGWRRPGRTPTCLMRKTSYIYKQIFVWV